MREIKFRVWDEVNKIMVYDLSDWTVDELNDDAGYDKMQFTGLLDKNGKEIYEGDIIREENCSPDDPAHGFCGTEYEVFYATSEASFMLKEIGENNKYQDLSCDYRKEVIGNIYENPEL